MSILRTTKRLISRFLAGSGKIRWGARAVGWPATIVGSLRLARLKLVRPARAEVRLRQTGATMTFNYPKQLVPALVVFGDLIDPEYAFLREVARPDWIFLDVCAAIGQFTVFAAGCVGGWVHAFEPSPENLATLRANIRANGIADRVSVHAVALSDQAGEAEFTTETNPFMSHLDAGSPGGGDPVRIEPLSNFTTEMGIEHVSVLKVNVAGGEPAVIEGAKPFLAGGGADVLVLLIGPQSYDAYRELEEMGYRFFFYHPRQHQVHEVASLDDDGLIRNRPWPARHVLGIWSPAIGEVLGNSITIASTAAPRRRSFWGRPAT